MKKISVIAAVLMIVFLLVACGGGDSAGSDGGETTTPSINTDTDATEDNTVRPDTSASSSGGLPDNLADLTIVLNSDAITFPLPFEDFLALGWVLESGYGHKPDKTLEPKQFTMINLQKNGGSIIVITANYFSDETATVRQGTVDGLSALDDTTEFPDGIKVNVSNIDDVIAAYGEPTESENTEYYDAIIFIKEDYRIVFLYNPESGVVTQINVLTSAINDGFEYVSLD